MSQSTFALLVTQTPRLPVGLSRWAATVRTGTISSFATSFSPSCRGTNSTPASARPHLLPGSGSLSTRSAKPFPHRSLWRVVSSVQRPHRPSHIRSRFWGQRQHLFVHPFTRRRPPSAYPNSVRRARQPHLPSVDRRPLPTHMGVCPNGAASAAALRVVPVVRPFRPSAQIADTRGCRDDSHSLHFYCAKAKSTPQCYSCNGRGQDRLRQTVQTGTGADQSGSAARPSPDRRAFRRQPVPS